LNILQGLSFSWWQSTTIFYKVFFCVFCSHLCFFLNRHFFKLFFFNFL
jgi:hypothetical protein